MPWATDDAERHTKKALLNANACGQKLPTRFLTDTGDEGRAIREANAAVAKDYAKSNDT